MSFHARGAKLVAAAVAYRAVADEGSRFRRRWHALRTQFWNLVCGADLNPAARIDASLRMPHPNGVVIHEAASIGADCLIMQQVTIGEIGPGAVPRLGRNVYVGAGAKILGDVEVGNGARIGANAVVLHDVPPGTTSVGIPARVVKTDAR